MRQDPIESSARLCGGATPPRDGPHDRPVYALWSDPLHSQLRGICGGNNTRGCRTTGREWFRFLCFFGFRDETNKVDKVKLANRMNSNFKLSRAYGTKKGNLAFDYYLSCKNGVGSHQVLHTFRKFLQYSRSALAKHDESNIVE